MRVDEAPEDDGPGAPRQSYNFAPGYYGIVYRADTPDEGAGPRQHKKGEGKEPAETAEEHNTGETRYKLQSMKWGLIPFWTKRNPDYGSMMKTINCRDDSLIDNKGMWTTMKQKKRCIVVAEGFYEWLKKGKAKVPHYTKRKDGQLMYFAGLWDCVQYEGSEDKHYTYTVITTDSNKQLKFLHDRMPVILENGSEDLLTWLDPKRYTWSKELQSLLKPFDGELECYPVSQEVGKVGNNSPQFIVPVASSENKSNIANFFAKGAAKTEKAPVKSSEPTKATSPKNFTVQEKEEEKDTAAVKDEENTEPKIKSEPEETRVTTSHSGTEDNAPLPVPESAEKGIKRELEDVPVEETPAKVAKTSNSPKKASPPPQKAAR